VALLSDLARRKKLEYFLGQVPRQARILEIGCADGWVGRYAVAHGWRDYTGIDVLEPPQPLPHRFVHGDVNRWRELGLEPAGYDAIVAFEVIEHGDLYDAISALLRPGGLLLVTTPVPRMDWACKILEAAGLNQRRSSPHTHLISLRDLPRPLRPVSIQVKAGISQWGIFQRMPAAADDGMPARWGSAGTPNEG
jgi:2-polyprenyl-3-methyl-5-hydroxy-6-metoxy-1,4-benzoquinol methylase